MFKKNDKFHGNDVSNSETSRAISDDDPVPQSLKETLMLMDSISQHLEDCAMEWRSKLSKKQWKMLDTENCVEKNLDLALLSRTYFTNETLDNAFEKLLDYFRKFMEYLNHFIALLEGKCSITISPTTKDVEIQNIDYSPVPDTPQEIPNHPNPIMMPLDLSLLQNKSPINSERRRSKRLADNAVSDVQQRFADLIRAKIELDTKFLGFEAALRGGPQVPPPSTNDLCSCLCQICSNVLGTVIDKQKILNDSVIKTKKRRATTKLSPKRGFERTARLWRRNETRMQSVSLVNIADKSIINPKKVKNS